MQYMQEGLVKMIFVTVGTGKFENLVKEVDRIADKIKEKILIQIGNGDYTPKKCKYFRFKSNLSIEYSKARLIIAHGGAGTIYELLNQGKKLIGVANLERTDTHQEEILKALSREGYIMWCESLNQLEECIKRAGKFKFKRYKKPECKIAEKIKEFLEK